MPSQLDYFDRVFIINLPSRVDRIRALRTELSRVGFDIDSPKVSVPFAPVPSDANGFPSRGVYGNFLSHLSIIETAYKEGVEHALVLEDDAIFSKRLSSSPIWETLSSTLWDMCFIGHSLSIAPTETGAIRSTAHFKWAHCYAVHRRAMPRLIGYLKETIDRPVGDPLGGKMYIDGALNLFRQFNPDINALLAAPNLSSQKGSLSNLNDPRWFDSYIIAKEIVSWGRRVRDELWRRGWLSN